MNELQKATNVRYRYRKALLLGLYWTGKEIEKEAKANLEKLGCFKKQKDGRLCMTKYSLCPDCQAAKKIYEEILG